MTREGGRLPAGPPRWLVRRIARRLPPEVADAILGDLEEHFSRKLASRGRARAFLWYARQAAAVLSPMTRAALVRAYDGRPGHPGRFAFALTSVPGDLRLAARRLLRSPGYTVTTLLTLALGIGANAAIFSVVRGVLLRPLPYDDPDRLVWFYEHSATRGWDRAEVTSADYLDWVDRARSFDGLTAMQDWPEEMTLQTGRSTDVVQGLRVAGSFFRVLGVGAQRGRGFTDDETWAGADDIAVLSHAFWMRAFGGDPDVIGRSVVLSGRTRTIVGVMPPTFRTPAVVWASPDALAEPTDVWIPFGWSPSDRDTPFFRFAHVVQVVGRLRAGVGPEAARREMADVMAGLAAERPETNADMGAGLEPLASITVEQARLPLLLMMGAVGLVLLVACANLATLALVRAVVHARQTAICAALGADRRRLLVRSMGESLLLAVAGGALGMVLALRGTGLLVRVAPADLPRMDTISVDGTVLSVAFLVTLATGVVFGLVPALRSARAQPEAALGAGTPGAGASRLGWASSRALIAAQVALSLTLAGAAGLLLRTVVNLRRQAEIPPGVLVARLSLPAESYPTRASYLDFWGHLLERASGLPGVETAALSSRLPLQGGWRSNVVAQGWAPGRLGRNVMHREITPDYLDAVDVPLVRGRPLRATDGVDDPPVTLVNEAFAAKWFRGEDALGRQITFDDRPGPTSTWTTIVGVVADRHQEGLRTDPEPEVLAPWAQVGGRSGALLLPVSGDPRAVEAPLRDLLRELDPTLALSGPSTLDDLVRAGLARERFLLGLLASFAVVALSLSMIGVFGVTAHAVSQGTRELGVRAALGAERGALLRGVVRTGMRPVMAGVALGLVGWMGVSALLGSLLFGVKAADPVTLVAVAALVSGAGLAASWLPGRRAGRVDPIVVMRDGW